MSNDELQLSVTEELIWDPKVDSNAIAVTAEDGVVTLRGTVGSLREKREAKKDAERVHGVKHVGNELDVQIMNDERRAKVPPRRKNMYARPAPTATRNAARA